MLGGRVGGLGVTPGVVAAVGVAAGNTTVSEDFLRESEGMPVDVESQRRTSAATSRHNSTRAIRTFDFFTGFNRGLLEVGSGASTP